jgi:hydroxymethylbilane synthase
VQVQELQTELQKHHPHVQFEVHEVSTVGDRDQATSLRSMGRTDFFTRDIDEGVLSGRFQIGIHSAKDLPEPLPTDLTIFCLTKGIDPSDSLVLSPGKTLNSLPQGALIATSSLRREEAVRTLRPDLSFCDLRGTIKQRLAKLATGEVHGVVVAEAALIRLKLTHLNRMRLPGETVKGQGQLAVVGKESDDALKALFQCLDSR